MPIYEYICQDCDEAFESWVRKETDTPACPACASTNLEKQLSLPRMHTSGTHEKSMRAAAKRDKKQQDENVRAAHEYEHSHHEH